MQQSVEQFYNRLRYLGTLSCHMDIEEAVQSYDSESGKYIVPAGIPHDDNILLAWHDDEPYEGWLCVVYRDWVTGKLYAHSDSHCSCNGFEEPWGPGKDSEVTMEWLVSALLNDAEDKYDLEGFCRDTSLSDRKVLADYLQERFS